MKHLPDADHIFRHIKSSWMDGEFVEPAAFRLREDPKSPTGFENGLSVNWVEFFQMADPAEAVVALCRVMRKNGRTVGTTSTFAMLNNGDVKIAASKYAQVAVVHDKIPPSDGRPGDLSHSLVTGYETYNDEVAEAIHKVILRTYPAAPATPARTILRSEPT